LRNRSKNIKLKFLKIVICVLSLVFCSTKLAAGNFNNIDSLLQVLKQYTQYDTNKVNTLIEISWHYNNQSKYQTAIDYSKIAYDISRKLKFHRGSFRAAHSLGSSYKELGQYETGLEYFKASLAVKIKLKNRPEMASSYNAIGDIYNNQGNYKEALRYFILSLDIFTETKNIRGMAWANSNIGVVLSNQSDINGAISHFKLAIKLAEEINDKKSAAWFANNLGNTYLSKKDYKTALDYFNKSLKNQKEANIVGNSLAFTYNSIGMANFNLGNSHVALANFNIALGIRKEIGDKNGISWSLNDIGVLHARQKNYSKAIECYEEALKIAVELNSLERIRNSYHSLSNVYALKKDYTKAYQNHILYTEIKDSIFNETVHEQVREINSKYESDKKDAALKIMNKEKKLSELEIENNKIELKNHQIQRNYFITGLILLVALAFFIYNRFQVSQKQKKIIELKEHETKLQKEVIEEKHKEITDSINYAERIQRSFLATKELLDENLKDYFVLFKPKDIVSGDFYFASVLTNGNFVLVTADSTGHGVPGAIMSLLNITSLEKAIENNNQPAEILNTTRQVIIDRLKKDGSAEGGKDGMDASLTVYNFKEKKLSVSSANNPVWIVRASTRSATASESSATNETIEIKPDKMPVGKHDKQDVSFSQQEIDLLPGDVVYTLTDGFPDQFGGEKGKKFMTKNLRDLLSKNAHLPMNEQKELLENTLKNWVGDLEQIDDITLIGVRI